MNKDIPLISIVGRPNVGKSTLFNRLMGRRLAIVDDMPGVTRDRIFGRTSFGGSPCYLVDTGGLTSDPDKNDIERGVEKQIMMSIDGSAAIIFLTDAISGPVPEDRYVSDILRRSNKPVILVANKADNQRFEAAAHEMNSLGLGEPTSISAQHGNNIEELIERITTFLPPSTSEMEHEKDHIRFCVVGRPNVGKSSIVNAILGEERCVVSSIPGTTRDRVDTDFVFEDIPFVIVDTAGMKRHKSHAEGLDFYSLNRAQRAVEESDVAVLVLDAENGLLEGDKRIANYIQKSKKGLLVAVNKMDLIENPDYDAFLDNMFASAPFLKNKPVLFISALEKSGMDSLLDNIVNIHNRFNERLPLELLKNVIYDTRMLYSPRSRGRRTGEILGVIHDRVSPPRIIIKVNDSDLFPPDYMRLIENRIRTVFNLSGVPLEMIVSDQGIKKKTGKRK